MFNNQSANKKISKLDEELTHVKSKLMLAQSTLIHSPQTGNQTHRSDEKFNFTTPPRIKQHPNISVHLATFIAQNTNFRQACEERSNAIQLQADKQLFRADKQIQQLQNRNEDLKNENLQKQKIIYSLHQTIAELREQLKHYKQKLEQANAYIERIDYENSQYRRENTEYMLQNKNFKADNKILSGYMERLQRQAALKNKEQKQQFQQKQKRIIKALYEKSFTQFNTTREQDLSQYRNDLSNKLLLDKTIKINEQNMLMMKKQIINLNDELQFVKKQNIAKEKQIGNYKAILSDYKVLKQLKQEIQKKLQQIQKANASKLEVLQKQNKMLKQDNELLHNQRDNFIKKAMFLRPGKIYNKAPSSI